MKKALSHFLATNLSITPISVTRIDSLNKKPTIDIWLAFYMLLKLVGGMDGTRTRDPLRDRQV
ncbi:hypothetical protein QA289_11300, partial [Glaesserella parasuis]|uniref:hypothetical protein n=1 Tax=Glaesserella parasuis TaxID=738 RepID=UPI00243659E9